MQPSIPKKKTHQNSVYADIAQSTHLVHSTISTTHPSISLQLDDDRVQYADVNHIKSDHSIDDVIEENEPGKFFITCVTGKHMHLPSN